MQRGVCVENNSRAGHESETSQKDEGSDDAGKMSHAFDFWHAPDQRNASDQQQGSRHCLSLPHNLNQQNPGPRHSGDEGKDHPNHKGGGPGFRAGEQHEAAGA